MYICVIFDASFLCCFPTACSATETEIFLPPQCKYIQNGEVFNSFLRSTCNLEHCTTNSGPCHDSDRLCCCRSLKTEPIDVECEGSFISGAGISTNETHCGCTVCDDILVTVNVLVREPGSQGTPIIGARILDKKTGDLLGLTFVNGRMTFSVPLESKKVSVVILAANYLPREHVIHLKPPSIDVVIALLRRNPIPVNPGDSGYTFRLGEHVYISVHTGGFSRNGTMYNDVVMFDGAFMEATDEGFIDMVDGRQFVLDEGYFFTLSYMTHVYFTDPDGNELNADRMDYFVEVLNTDATQQDTFLVTYNQEEEKWKNLGNLTLSNSLQKRQNADVLAQLNLPLVNFIFQANLAGIDCWLQVRSFDNVGLPSQGIVATVVQDGQSPNGMGFVYKYGTDTGSFQTTVDGLAENAICLPLECTDFIIGTVDGNVALIPPRASFTPRPFPADTFNASETGAPILIGQYFVFQEVVTATDTELRPFYENLDDCKEAAMIGETADAKSFFSFTSEFLVRVDDTDSCFIKIRITECLRNSANTVIQASDVMGGMQNAVVVDYEQLLEEFFSADHFIGNACIKASRIECIPFPCNRQFQITVVDDNGEDFCNISNRSPIVQSPFLSGDSTFNALLINSAELAEQDYNKPDLGMYFNPNPAVAREICRVPESVMDNPMNLDSVLGYAATFDCI